MLSDIQHTLLPYLQHYGGYAGWIAFFAAFFESLLGVGYLLPGSTIVLLMGVFAGQGFIDIKIVLFFAFLGAVAGDQSNYYIGKRYGDNILKISWLHLSGDMIQKAQKFLDKNGSVSVFFGRLMPGVKESISFVAGTLGMRYYKFLFWELLGAFIWTLEFVGIGYLFSTSLFVAQLWLSRSIYIFLILGFFFGIIYLFIYFIKQNAPTALEILNSFKKSILTNKRVLKWVSNHPKTIIFFKKRTDKSSFFGLPFSILLITFLYILGLFGGIVEDLLSKDPIVAVDHIIANIIPALRTQTLNSFFTYITLFGKTEIVLAAIFLTATALWICERKIYIIPLIVSTVGATIFIYLSKLAFHRPRPDIALYYESSYSFPSGHATIAVVLYGFIAYLAIHFSNNFRKKLNIFFLSTILILLIGISRIYLGEHYLSDVYSGYLLGTLWLIVGVAFTKWIEEKSKISAVKITGYMRIMAVVTITCFVLFFVAFSQSFSYKKASLEETQNYIISTITTPLEQQSYFTQSLAGFDTWPVNIIFVGNSLKKLKNSLNQANWQDTNSIKYTLPIFWNYKKSDIFLKQKNYLLKIWKTNFLTVQKKPIFVATTIKVDGYQWQIIPKFSPDIDNARVFITNSLKKAKETKKIKIFNSKKAFIGKDIIGNNYFTDGRCNIIYTKNQSDK